MASTEYAAGVLYESLGHGRVQLDVPLSAHTTFHIGGKADYLISPTTVNELQKALLLLRELKIPYVVFGKGSNVLVADAGFRGAVIRMTDLFHKVEVRGAEAEVECGIPLNSLSRRLQEASLAGAEFLYGIPGTLGGAIYMNAGAYEHEICELVKSVKVMDMSGFLFDIPAEDLAFGYRTSAFRTKSWIAVSARLRLREGDSEEILRRMNDYRERRKEKQPLDLPSAGSVFKRPEGHFAGKLIEEAGLKGACVGGAEVSTTHAGFIVNKGGARAADVIKLIHHIQEKVEETSGVRLEREVLYLGPKGFDAI